MPKEARSMRVPPAAAVAWLALVLAGCASTPSDDVEVREPEDTDTGADTDTDTGEPAFEDCVDDSLDLVVELELSGQDRVDAFCDRRFPSGVRVAELTITSGVTDLSPLTCACVERLEIIDADVQSVVLPASGALTHLRVHGAHAAVSVSLPRVRELAMLELQEMSALEEVELDALETAGTVNIQDTPGWDLRGMDALTQVGTLQLGGALGAEDAWDSGSEIEADSYNVTAYSRVDLDALPCVRASHVTLFHVDRLTDPTLSCTTQVESLIVRDAPSLTSLQTDTGLAVTDELRLWQVPSLAGLGNLDVRDSLQRLSLRDVPAFAGLDELVAKPALEQILALQAPVDPDPITAWSTLQVLHLAGSRRAVGIHTDADVTALQTVELLDLPAFERLDGLRTARDLGALRLHGLPVLDDLTPLHDLDTVRRLSIQDTPKLSPAELDAFLDAVTVEEVERLDP